MFVNVSVQCSGAATSRQWESAPSRSEWFTNLRRRPRPHITSFTIGLRKSKERCARGITTLFTEMFLRHLGTSIAFVDLVQMCISINVAVALYCVVPSKQKCHFPRFMCWSVEGKGGGLGYRRDEFMAVVQA